MANKKHKLSRRTMISSTAKGVVLASLPLGVSQMSCEKQTAGFYDFIVIGSGFGATVVVTELLRRNPRLRILILERGVWWASYDRDLPRYIADAGNDPDGTPLQPVQYFTKPDHSQGTRYL